MDEKTKELALAFEQKNSERILYYDKFPVRLGDYDTMCARLLGWYANMVKGRGVPFILDKSTETKIEKVVRWMLDTPKRGLLLCGTLGNGKTTMLRSLKYLFGSNAVYMEAQQVYDYFKQNQSLPPVAPKDVLLIDDLGVEPPSYNDFGNVRYPLAELLMARYRTNSTTVIASNCTFAQIGETYGDRVKDRMKEMFATITYTEESYRK